MGIGKDAGTAGRTDRRALLLDTAIAVIASHGLRGLTHRAVQEAAGLPHGSVTYYFKTRDMLILAVVDRMIEIDKERSGPAAHELLRAIATRSDAPDYDRIAELLRGWWSESRELLLARFELELAGAREPLIRDAMARCRAEFRQLAELIALAAGSEDARFDAEVVTKLIDGLMFDFVTRAPQDPRHLTTGLRRAIEPIKNDRGTTKNGDRGRRSVQ
ncbi:TetR/AcrR family transcriptional regulator [Actinomadura oligospora]|uniref:TetR/AcrR family transcriptional regulator n=1 Tax=Actinomadura oligospora TaxID=111804 RepID=UPI0004B2AAB3|nr:TetR/AcrR family transcriptional regulator [Actinomadura oligospora]